jgi:hypothetical protein
MGLREDIKAAITGNAPIMAILTGGVHADTITRQTTPAAYDATSLELKPCARVRLETETPAGPYVYSVRTPVAIYYYQRAGSGYAQIDAAKQLVYELLHHQKLPGVDGIWEIAFADEVNDQADDTLAASMAMQRFYVTRMRA